MVLFSAKYCLPQGSLWSIKRYSIVFLPHQFSTPTDLDHGDICVSFFHFQQKKCISECLMKEGEVACTSGGKMGKSKRFSCKTKHCKFCFTLKWDRFGYYIDHCNPEKWYNYWMLST
eukprot:scaffold132185_cov61-Cyclotella_meneghiniana.AAC.3